MVEQCTLDKLGKDLYDILDRAKKAVEQYEKLNVESLTEMEFKEMEAIVDQIDNRDKKRCTICDNLSTNTQRFNGRQSWSRTMHHCWLCMKAPYYW